MTTFAFVPTTLHGHVNPTLAVARELSSRGHAVTYHLPDVFAAAVAATGAALSRYEVALPAPDSAPPDPVALAFKLPFRMTTAARTILPQVLPALRRDRPDVLIYDALSVWGRIAAELLPVRAAMAWASYAINQEFSYLAYGAGGDGVDMDDAIDGFASDMYALSKDFGAPRIDLHGLLEHSEPLTLVFIPRALQPASETFDEERYCFVGPPRRAEHEPAGPDFAGLGERPLTYISLGTVFNDWPRFYDACFEAFGDGAWDVVLSGAGEQAGCAPPGFLVREFVPQLAVLDRARVFVTHGGMNSVLEALERGVPMVIVPQTPEQAVTARTIAEAGAGVAIERAQLTAASLRAAVETIAGDDRHQIAAQRLRDRSRSGGAEAAADALVRYADVTHA